MRILKKSTRAGPLKDETGKPSGYVAGCDAETCSPNDHDFRGRRMKGMMDELYETMIRQLIDDKYISMENYFLDGTKIEANANKYSFVWKKATKGFEEKLKVKIQENLRQIHELAQAEEIELGDVSLEEPGEEQLGNWSYRQRY